MRMQKIDGWTGGSRILVARSKGGVTVTVNALDNLIKAGTLPWPTPEIIQKLYASSKFAGVTDEDDSLARSVLGHYCDLQSLNSEDAVTWSVFGPLIYSGREDQQMFATRLFERVALPRPKAVAIWLWRRIPHPEKLESQGGPEIDFGILSDSCLVLGEAKWNSSLGVKQGVAKNRTQQELRCAYCDELGRNALPGVTTYCVLGVGRKADVLDCSKASNVMVRNITWNDVAECLPNSLSEEVSAYLAWKSRNSK